MPSRFTKQEIWAHNGLRGSTIFALRRMESIAKSKTTTPNAKATANKIASLLTQLAAELKERDE